MSEQGVKEMGDQKVSKLKLAVGAASLFLFIIGVKRTFQMDQAEGAGDGERSAREEKPQKGRRQRRPRRG